MLKKVNKKQVITYLICFVMIFVLSHASIFDVTPFGFAFAAAAVFFGLNPFLIAAMLLVATVPALDGYVTLYALYGGVILILFGLIAKKLKSVKPFYVFIPALVCSAGEIAYMSINHYGLYKIFLYLFLLIAFTSVCYCYGIPTYVRQLKYAFVQHETICGFVILTIFSCGLSCFGFYGFDPLLVAFALFLPLSYKILGAQNTLVGAMCMGLGGALAGSDVMIVAAFVFTACMVLIFVSAKKVFMPLVTLISYAAFVLFFKTEYATLLYSTVGIFVGGAIYMFIPLKYIRTAAEFLNNDFDRTALRYVVNQSRYETGNSLAALGRIFCEMAAVMRSSKSGKHIDAQVVAEYVRDKSCVMCSKYDSCRRIPAMAKGLTELCEISLQKGRAGVGDLPTSITQYCCNVAQLIASAADAAAQAGETKSREDTENKAREIVAGQLVGLSEILSGMGQSVSLPFSYDTDAEKRLAEELLYIGVICSEALITGVEEPETITLVVLANGEKSNEKLEACIERCLKKKFKVVKQEQSILSGWNIIELKRAPVYDALFGFAGRTKQGSDISGDTHSFIKLTHDKFMMAMCDGMGSGREAHEFSENTISLIESFYKAGFNHDMVLDNVNKFLSIGNSDIFSAVDVCVVDLGSGVADIIKIGSPAGYLKTAESIVKIAGEALPMGMLDELKPSVKSVGMAAGDILIIMSDGISDAFGSGLDDFINNLPNMNPSELCITITEQALKLSGGQARDDMSVAAFKLFYS